MTLFSKARNTVTLFDDVLPALDQLRKHWALGSVTNGTTDLSMTALPPYFKTSIASYRFGAAKPEPAIFNAACAELGLQPADIVYVGDDPFFDVLGPKQIGMHAVWMNRFDREYDGDVTPDGQCTNLFELLDWLNTHTNVVPAHELVASKPAQG
jgi:FMN phosphatase YigB (HAD superfamily)